MEPEKKDGLTLGQYVELVRSKNLIPPATFKGYLTRLRQIVSEIKGIKSTRNRFGPQGKGRQAWIVKVDSVPLGSIRPDDVRAWKRREIDKARSNFILRKQYTISVNSTLRQARSLFGERKVLKHLPVIEARISAYK